jgi:TonB family protein
VEVSDVLRDRVAQPAGLERMTAISVAAHVVLFGALFLLPQGWLSPAEAPPKTIINISLSGTNNGPNNGGLSSISQRAVQTEAPPPPRPEPVRPPAAVPEETVPVPSRQPPSRPTPTRPERASTPPPPVRQAPDDARGRTPTRGAEQREGNAIAETGARGQGFGLSTSSGQGTGIKLDITGDFCCPEYISLMVDRIRSGWDSKAAATAIVIVRYTILRDGTIRDTVVERSSGDPALDLRAQRAVVNTRQLPPLPAGYNNPSLTMHLTFEYRR